MRGADDSRKNTEEQSCGCPGKAIRNGVQEYKILAASRSVAYSYPPRSATAHSHPPRTPEIGLVAKWAVETVKRETQKATGHGVGRASPETPASSRPVSPAGAAHRRQPVRRGSPQPRVPSRPLTGHVAQVPVGDGSAELERRGQHLPGQAGAVGCRQTSLWRALLCPGPPGARP